MARTSFLGLFSICVTIGIIRMTDPYLECLKLLDDFRRRLCPASVSGSTQDDGNGDDIDSDWHDKSTDEEAV